MRIRLTILYSVSIEQYRQFNWRDNRSAFEKRNMRILEKYGS
jgi:hypothetical protein